MTKIPPALKNEILTDPTYKTCMLYGHHGHTCEGRITLEHTIRYAGRQVQAKFAIIALCAKGHEVDQFQDAHTMNKDLNEWCAYNRASAADLISIEKSNPQQRLKYLNGKYGVWTQKFPLDKALAPVEIALEGMAKKPIPTEIEYRGRMYIPISKDQKHIDFIRRHCLEVEGIRYNDDKIVSMAIEAYAKELEAVRDLVQ